MNTNAFLPLAVAFIIGVPALGSCIGIGLAGKKFIESAARQPELTPMLQTKLLEELASYPGEEALPEAPSNAIVMPLRLRTPVGLLSLISTTTIFGTPLEITLAELALESFFPADAATAAALNALQADPAPA